MSKSMEGKVKGICEKFGRDRTRMMDIVREVQAEFQHVPEGAMSIIADECNTHRVEVESVVSFYAFLTDRPQGKVVIRLCNDVVDKMRGVDATAFVLEQAFGIKMGETTADGAVTLEWTPCIGLSDQAPAALINDEPVTWFSTDKAQRVAESLKEHLDARRLVRTFGDGNNAHPLVRAMVVNNIRKTGPVIFGEYHIGDAIRKALAMSPVEVIRDVKTARLRGRGGAGFPAGMKWEFTRNSGGATRTLICNADEGEPGTFKDRVVLTERPDLLIEGMTIAAYAIGAERGILYLRAEYAYLRAFLEKVLERRREMGLLGLGICDNEKFNFDIRIQMGAGAYICGEETSLISSCEGLRGDPKTRPPFPAQKGYLDTPTCVNNVETLCCVPPILENGPAWFAQLGSKGSPGTKLLSISGDCSMPGIYEVEFGTTLQEVLQLAGADEPKAVQIGGPSGQLIGEAQFNRTICYDDLATGGSLVIFGQGRKIVEIARQYTEFFIEECCGYCTPCRVGMSLMKRKLDELLAGKGSVADLDYLAELGKTVKLGSRCGLGQTAANPILTSLANFRSDYTMLIAASGEEAFLPTFDLKKALGTHEKIAGRKSAIFEE